MASTYTLIGTTTIASNTSSVVFSSIPNTYTDLELIINGIGISGGTDWYMRLNNDSGTNYYRQLAAAWRTSGSGTVSSGGGNNGTGSSSGQLGFHQIGFGNAYSGSMITKIAGYTNADTYTHWITQGASGFSQVGQEIAVVGGMWTNKTTVSTLSLSADNFGGGSAMGAGSVISLYGIKAA